MTPRASSSARPTWRILADQAAILAAVTGLGWSLIDRPRGTPVAPPPVPVAAVLAPEPLPEPEPAPEPAPPPAPALDLAAIARARGSLDAAKREREDAERQVAEAEERLAAVRREADEQAQATRALTGQIREPGARLASIQQRGEVLKTDCGQIRAELASLANSPRPRRKPLIDKTPVAKPIDGEEFHFEVRRDRIAYIDLDRLLEKVKSDALLQMRLGGGQGARPITSTVGPIGDFAMRYELGRDLPSSLDEAMRARGVSYSLRGWEIVPVRAVRGETIDAIGQPASRIGRVLNALRPDRTTITLWIYPDGFPLYRRLRDILHARGFTVAARPLPEGLAIRGSPVGSVSAGQ